MAENLVAGSVVGTFTTSDPDVGDTHTYSLVAGQGSDDNASFSIDGAVLKTATVFDAEAKSTYTIRVRTTDQTDRSFERVFTIHVSAANDALVRTSRPFAPIEVAEGSAGEAAVTIDVV